MNRRMLLAVAACALMSAGCGIQAIPLAKNDVAAKSAELMNEYKRRADLVPQLIGVVSGEAKYERSTLVAVIKARALATSVTLDPSHATPAQLRAFQNAQGGLSQALGRLMVVSERYPHLRANEAFLDLQSQLEGTENRIKIARQDLIQSIQAFNDLVTVFPDSVTNGWFYHYQPMPQWDVPAEERKTDETAPTVKF